MQLVLAGAIGEERVVGATQLGNEVTEGEDEAKDELLVVGMRHAFADGSHHVAIACDGGARRRASGGFGRGRGWAGGRPAARVDALGCTCGQRVYKAVIVTSHDDLLCRSKM